MGMMTDFKNAEKANANLQKYLFVRMLASPFRTEDILCAQFHRDWSVSLKYSIVLKIQFFFLGLKSQSRDKQYFSIHSFLPVAKHQCQQAAIVHVSTVKNISMQSIV